MKRILIIKPSSMGDVVHAFPAVYALMQEPDQTVDWVINPAFSELLDYLPGLGRKIFFRRRELGKITSFFPAAIELLRELRWKPYDAVIDLQGLFRSALVGLFAGGKRRYGPAAAREPLARLCYNRKLHYPAHIRHAVEKNCAMIGEFSGRSDISPDYRLPKLEKYASSADHLLEEHGLADSRFIAAAPGARWETKQWPPEFFAACIGKTAENLPDVPFVLLGSPAEQPLCKKIAAAARNARTVDLSGKTTPGTLTEIIRRAALLLCNDSGPMHLAAAVGTPVTALFGPTDPGLTGPYGKNCRILQPDLNCIKCFHKNCPTEECHRKISPEAAASAIMEQIRKGVGVQ
jgi:lipopolysaccharide heptosyltransferase I